MPAAFGASFRKRTTARRLWQKIVGASGAGNPVNTLNVAQDSPEFRRTNLLELLVQNRCQIGVPCRRFSWNESNGLSSVLRFLVVPRWKVRTAVHFVQEQPTCNRDLWAPKQVSAPEQNKF